MSEEIEQPSNGSADDAILIHKGGSLSGKPKYLPGQGSGIKRSRNKQGSFKRAIRLTDQVKSEILIQLRRGAHLETAFAYARIPGQTYRAWITQAQESLEKAQQGGHVTDRRKKLIRFLAEVEEAQAQAEQRLVRNVQDAANAGVWQAALSLLERRYPDRWSKRTEGDQKISVTVGFGYVEVSSNQPGEQPAQGSALELSSTPIPATRQLTAGDQPTRE